MAVQNRIDFTFHQLGLILSRFIIVLIALTLAVCTDTAAYGQGKPRAVQIHDQAMAAVNDRPALSPNNQRSIRKSDYVTYSFLKAQTWAITIYYRLQMEFKTMSESDLLISNTLK